MPLPDRRAAGVFRHDYANMPAAEFYHAAA